MEALLDKVGCLRPAPNSSETAVPTQSEKVALKSPARTAIRQFIASPSILNQRSERRSTARGSAALTSKISSSRGHGSRPQNYTEAPHAPPYILPHQPLRTIGGGGGGDLPLPTKHPPKVIEPITKTIASATFCILHPMNRVSCHWSHNRYGGTSARKPHLGAIQFSSIFDSHWRLQNRSLV